MGKKFLIVVDVQNDFVSDALGTKEAKQIMPGVLEKVRDFDGEVLFTLDTHFEDYMDTREGHMLPVPHCIKGTRGWELAAEFAPLRESRPELFTRMFEKNTFGSTGLAQYLKEVSDTEGIESVELIGLCTDICVISNALLIKAFMPEIPVLVDSSCCAGVTVPKHEAALEVMRSCQILVK